MVKNKQSTFVSIIKFLSKKESWHYQSGIEYSYDRTHCTGNCNDYCRCTEIINAKIESIDFNCLLNSILDKSKDVIQSYCVDRLFRSSKLSNTDNWEVSTCRGYYGEEFDGFYPCDFITTELINNFNTLEDMDDLDKIKFCLKEEYGYLLPDVERATNLDLVEAKLEDIVLNNNEYMRKIDKKYVKQYNEFELPRAVCLKVGDKYRVIDGYHRMTSAFNCKLETSFILVLS